MNPGMISQVIGALVLIFIKLSILSAIILMFSLFVSPPLNVALTILISVIGHLSINYINIILTDSYSSGLVAVVKLTKFLLPSFEFFRINEALLRSMHIGFGYYLEVALYGIIYIFFILLISNLIFREKEL